MKPYYEHAGITIYHGDCREVLPQLEDGSSDIAVTSPPYNLVKEWGETSGPNSLFRKWQAAKDATWYADSIPEEEYQAIQKEVLTELLRVCASSVFYNHKLRYAFKRRGRIIHPLEWLADFPLWAEVIWDRGSGMTHNSRRLIISDERIYWFRRPEKWHPMPYFSVWHMQPDNEMPDHPCAFPRELPARCLALATDPCDTVLDPYMGSATTLFQAAKWAVAPSA